ncbi:MAG: CBS domain-containing protein [Planctomycetota bacterium]
MLDEGIHRVFVVEQRRLVGVVSTTDVMRLLADP